MIEPEFVQIVADGLGVKPSEDANKTLAPDVEYRMREIIQVKINHFNQFPPNSLPSHSKQS